MKRLALQYCLLSIILWVTMLVLTTADLIIVHKEVYINIALIIIQLINLVISLKDYRTIKNTFSIDL